MYERKENDTNCYYPSFFYTYLDIPDDPQYLARYPMDERTEALFLHEYIHNLQDLTTPSGYARIETIVDQVKWAVEEASRKKNLRIPFDPTSTWAYNMRPNAVCLQISKGEMKKKTMQQTDVVYAKPKELKKSDVLAPIKNGRNVRVKAVTTFIFEDEKGDEYLYRIGEMAISESMAYIMENHLYPGVIAEPADFPYKVVRNVVRWKCPQAEDDLVMAAICDVCLMYTFPGIAFYHLITFLETYTARITPELIYLHGLSMDMANNLGVEGWTKYLDDTNKETIKQLDDYFNHPYWNNTKYALRASLVNAYSYRKNKLMFMIDIMRGGRICQNHTFQEVLSYMGSMSIKTANNHLLYFSPRGTENMEIDPDWFVSLFQLYQILFGKDTIVDLGGHRVVSWRCCLKDWCQDSFLKKNLTDITSTSYNCVEEPWLNVTEDLMAQCSFGRLWAAYGFNRVKLKPNYSGEK